MQAASHQADQKENYPILTYWVGNVNTREDRTAVAGTGADIIEIGTNYVIVNATEYEARQIALGYPSYNSFVKEISGARTFCLLEDVQVLRANGYARGGSLENAVVIHKSGILNPDGLRFPEEFVRHKILDLIGDLSLLGHPIIGAH